MKAQAPAWHSSGRVMLVLLQSFGGESMPLGPVQQDLFSCPQGLQKDDWQEYHASLHAGPVLQHKLPGLPHDAQVAGT